VGAAFVCSGATRRLTCGALYLASLASFLFSPGTRKRTREGRDEDDAEDAEDDDENDDREDVDVEE